MFGLLRGKLSLSVRLTLFLSSFYLEISAGQSDVSVTH